MIAALGLGAVVALFALLLRALRLLPGHARDQWHHGWLGLGTVAYLVDHLPWRGAHLAAAIVAGFCLVCLGDDAVKHALQAWKYHRARTYGEQQAALHFECGLHSLAALVGLI